MPLFGANHEYDGSLLETLNRLIACGLLRVKMAKTLFCTRIPQSPVAMVSVCRPIAVCCVARQSYDLDGVSERPKNFL
jgi:hypothetical protein